MLTTLTAAAVVPCQLAAGRSRAKFVVCVCNVGDSLAYVFSGRHGVREITKGLWLSPWIVGARKSC